ncbi:hypothetical protein EJD97_011729, partial [Solanum chilense]
MQAHHQEILQKITLQQSLTDTSIDRHACDGPLHESVVQGVSRSEEASGSAEVPAPATAAKSASSDEADSLDSTPGSPTGALTPVANHPNHWYVDRQYQVYSDAKFLNDKVFMTRTLILERRVNISLPAIRRYLYGKDIDANRTPLTPEFDFRWKIVKDGQFLREPFLRVTTKIWMALHLSVDREGADWVTKPKGAITKANLTFTAKFLWLIICHFISPMAADNIVTWDHTVLIAAMVAGFEVDFAWLLQAVMHERTFKAAYETTYTTSVESIPHSSTSPSSSRSAPFPALVSFTRVQKLEKQMALLLHHIQPWMKRSNAEAEERVSVKWSGTQSKRLMRVPDSEAPYAEPAEDTVMVALFATSEIPPPPNKDHDKRYKDREEDEARSRKKERHEMEAVRRAALADDEARRIRVVESVASASCFGDVETAGGTADSVVADEDTLR